VTVTWTDPEVDAVFPNGPGDDRPCEPEWQPRDVDELDDISQYQETT
jgi:hypothetical protein